MKVIFEIGKLKFPKELISPGHIIGVCCKYNLNTHWLIPVAWLKYDNENERMPIWSTYILEYGFWYLTGGLAYVVQKV